MTQKDVGRSWLILFSTTMLMFIETGIVKSLGVLLPDIREQFSTKTWVIGFAISLTPGFGAIICFGTGTSAVAGGALSQYFDEYYNFAATTSLSGMSLSMVVMPLVTQLLLDLYGLRGTILLLSGISVHGVACGALFKPNTHDGYSRLSSSLPTNVTANARYKNRREVAVDYLKDFLDTTLFTNFPFITCFTLLAGNGFYTTGWLVYVVPHVIEVGFTPYEASLVATIGGFANFVGNFMYPLLVKILSKERQLYLSVFLITASLAFDAVASFRASYIGLIMCAIAFGIGRGVMSAAVYPVMNDAIDEDRMINAFGWVYAVYGLTSVLGGFTCGWLYDKTGNYTLSFVILSAVCMTTLLPACINDSRKYF